MASNTTGVAVAEGMWVNPIASLFRNWLHWDQFRVCGSVVRWDQYAYAYIYSMRISDRMRIGMGGAFRGFFLLALCEYECSIPDGLNWLRFLRQKTNKIRGPHCQA